MKEFVFLLTVVQVAIFFLILSKDSFELNIGCKCFLYSLFLGNQHWRINETF
jgi:hypothetical protein